MPRIRLDNVRLSFPQLFKPVAMKAGDKPACSASFLFPPGHPAQALVEDAVKKAAIKKWKDNGLVMLDALRQIDKLCIHNGTLKATKYDGYSGMLYVSARNAVPPTVKDRDPKINLTEASGSPY